MRLKKHFNAVRREQFPWVYDSPRDANDHPVAGLGQAFNQYTPRPHQGRTRPPPAPHGHGSQHRWNYCDQANEDHWRKYRRNLTGCDLNKICTGSSTVFDGIGDSTFHEVGQQYASKRKASKKSRPRWRVSDRKRRNCSLGWIPFKSRAATFKKGAVRFAGRSFRIWDSCGLDAYAIRAGCFAEDACGRWYFCVNATVETKPNTEGQPVGIDLGLKSAAVASNGVRCNAFRHRRPEQETAVAQRAKHKRRVMRLHAEVEDCRKYAQHKFSTAVVRSASVVCVGKVPVKLRTAGN